LFAAALVVRRRYFIVAPSSFPAAPLVARCRCMIVALRPMPAAQRMYSIVVHRPLPAAPLVLRCMYVAVVPRPMPAALAPRCCRRRLQQLAFACGTKFRRGAQAYARGGSCCGRSRRRFSEWPCLRPFCGRFYGRGPPSFKSHPASDLFESSSVTSDGPCRCKLVSITGYPGSCPTAYCPSSARDVRILTGRMSFLLNPLSHDSEPRRLRPSHQLIMPPHQRLRLPHQRLRLASTSAAPAFASAALAFASAAPASTSTVPASKSVAPTFALPGEAFGDAGSSLLFKHAAWLPVTLRSVFQRPAARLLRLNARGLAPCGLALCVQKPFGSTPCGSTPCGLKPYAA
jgi:hypothetical protein